MAVAAASIPGVNGQLDSAGTLTGDFYKYARQNQVIIGFLLFTEEAGPCCPLFYDYLAFFILWLHYLKLLQAVISSFICGTLAAILDEIHQYYVIGRSGTAAILVQPISSDLLAH